MPNDFIKLKSYQLCCYGDVTLVVVQQLELWTLRLRDSGFESFATVSNLGQVFYSGSLQFTVDIGGYLCTNSLHTLMAAWLDASHRNRDGV